MPAQGTGRTGQLALYLGARSGREEGSGWGDYPELHGGAVGAG